MAKIIMYPGDNGKEAVNWKDIQGQNVTALDEMNVLVLGSGGREHALAWHDWHVSFNNSWFLSFKFDGVKSNLASYLLFVHSKFWCFFRSFKHQHLRNQ